MKRFLEFIHMLERVRHFLGLYVPINQEKLLKTPTGARRVVWKKRIRSSGGFSGL